MFDNVIADDAELKASSDEENETSQDSQTKDETQSDDKSNDSEVDKTQKSKDKEDEKGVKKDDEDTKPFHQHSRFKELVKQKNQYKTQVETLGSQLDEIRQQIADVKGQQKSEVPEFETLEDLGYYLKDLPTKIEKNIVDKIKSQESSVKSEQAKADKIVNDQLEKLKDAGEEFNEKELIKFALEYEMTDLSKALKLQKKLNTKTEEAKKKGEDIGRRKKDSGLKTKSKSSGEEHLYVPGQDLDDIIEKAKANIPK